MPALDQLIDRFANVGNAAETAYAVLREAIVTNTLKPGTRLRASSTIAFDSSSPVTSECGKRAWSKAEECPGPQPMSTT